MMNATDPERLAPLSSSARDRVNWQRVTDALGLQSGVMRGEAGTAPDADAVPVTTEDRARLRQAIAVVRQEFSAALSSLRTLMRGVIVAIVVALALSVAGGVLLQVTTYASLISLASIGSLFGLLVKAWSLSRDQAMLELIPSRYSLAIEFCHTQGDARKLIAAFLAETTTLRTGSPQGKDAKP